MPRKRTVPKSVRTTMWVPTRDEEELKRIAARDRKTISAVRREAFSEYIARHKNAKENR